MLLPRMLAVSTILLIASVANAGTIAEGTDEKHKGETTIKGTYKVETEGENFKMLVHMSVKKTGNAAARGAIVFQILNHEWDPLFTIEEGFPPDALKGVTTKEFSRSATATGQKAKRIREEFVYAACHIDLETDKPRWPDSAGEWKKAYKDWNEVDKSLRHLKVGEWKEFGEWQFKRVK